MVRAWVYNESADGDQRSPHQPSPLVLVPQERLDQLGVLHWKIDPTGAAENPTQGKLGELRSQRGYKNHDVINISREKLPNYEEKLKIFFSEHLHEDEEIRFVLDGSGYFDVRDDVTNEWIRIESLPGDMIVLPEGMYHRFTLDEKNYIQAMRLFKEVPKWEALNRGPGADGTRSRQVYLDAFISKISPSSSSPSPLSFTTHTSSNGTSITLNNHASALAHYPHGRIYNGLIYISGLSSRRADNTHRGSTKNDDGTYTLNIEEQTRGVFENMKTVLSTVGGSLSDLIDLNVYLVDMKDYAKFNSVYNEYIPNAETGPSRTTVAVHQLPHPNLLIEIKAIAVNPKDRK